MIGFKVVCNNLSDTEMKDMMMLRRDKHKRPLGKGCTAKVYAFPEGSSMKGKWVYRVQKPQREFSIYPYLEFAEMAVKSKSRHLPKMKFLAYRTNSEGEVVEVVNVIEHLDHWVHHYDDVNDYWVSNLQEYLQGWGYYGKTLNPVKTKKGFTNASIRTLRKFFVSTFIDVNDLHEDNVMARRDGTLVVTDPVC